MRISRLLALPALVSAIHAQAPVHSLFDGPVLYPDTTEEAELLGDVDNDTDVDLLVFQSPPQSAIKTSFRVRFNDGIGNFTAGTAVTIPANSGSHVAYGDVTGDGVGDLLVSSFTTAAPGAGVYVFRGTGGGAFAAPVHVSLAGNVLRLFVGHANGDAIPDFFALHFAAGGLQGTWFAGTGGPTFGIASATLFPGLLQDGAEPIDADGDGLTDVAILAIVGSTTSLMVQRTTPTGLVPYATPPLLTAFLHELVPADWDGDGDQDLLHFSVPTVNQFRLVLLRNQGGGVFAPGAPQTFASSVPYRLFAGDLDGDGDLDLVTRGGSSNGIYSIDLLRNDGGVFAWARAGLVPLTTIGLGAGLGDLDGDGWLDFVDSRAIWFGSGDLSAGGRPRTTSLLDWDGDGDLDTLERPTLRRHDGNGTFTASPGIWPPDPATDQRYGDPLAIGDFDGDGLQEVVVSLFRVFLTQQFFLGMRRLEANGDDVLVDQGPAAVATSLMFGSGVNDDLDGNGTLDVFDRDGAWLNDGTGFFTLAPLGLQGYRPIAKADLDGDGDNDFLAQSTGVTSTALLMRTSPQGFTVVVLSPATGNVVDFNSAVLADLDDDGDLDVACRDRTMNAQRTRLFTNAGGVFTHAFDLPVQGVPLAGDVDGDGRTDLLVQDTDRLHVLPRLASGLAYAPAVVYGLRGAARLHDLDQDGDLDLMGGETAWNQRIMPPAAGLRRQYGQGGRGLDGRRPVLSAVGPITAGQTLTMRLHNALGGTLSVLVFSANEANVPNVLPGLTAYVASIDLDFAFVLGGAAGQPGAGSFDAGFGLPAGLAGQRVFAQFVAFDAAAPSGLSHSNGVEVRIGF